MSNPEPFEFVNRTDELQALRNRVFPRVAKGTLTFLRSPSGFGKSRLTDRLIDELSADGPACIVVDPAIRSKSRSDRIYAWFYVQRAADPAAQRPADGRREFRTFAQFMRESRRLNINWKQVYDSMKSVSSFRALIKIGVELAENVFKFGRYSPNTLLQEDSRYAGEAAQDYVRALVSFQPTLLVVRECQNVDPESLKFFLALGETAPFCSVIFEYTHPNNEFSVEHEKIIFETISGQTLLAVFDLVRLNLKEFRYLLKKYAASDQTIESVAELQWDGNLRIIRELKYRVMVGHAGAAPKSLDVHSAIQKNIATLPKQHRLILALVAVHVEAIDRDALIAVLCRIDPTISTVAAIADLAGLQGGEGYLRVEGNNIALADEDLIDAANASPVMVPLLKLAAVSLRDFYVEIINGKTFGHMRLQAALRQAVALCAETGDIFALRSLIGTLDAAARQAHNQTLYVNIVADVVLARSDLSDLERQELIGWASAAAYESGDFATTAKLTETLPELRPYDLALLACCYGELNRHADAMQLAARLGASTAETHDAATLAARLIECLNLFALGRKHEAGAVHAALRGDEAYAASPLFGFVLRFTELVLDFPNCTADVLASVKRFQLSGLKKSAAYSQLAGAMHFAYAGQIEPARQLVAAARQGLQPYVRDQQIILNNTAVVDLLSNKPDLAQCIEQLSSALFTVGDDFSRLTLHNNRLICFALAGDLVRAKHTVDVIDRILAAPGFGNRDIFVTVGFNVWRFYTQNGQPEKAARYKSLALAVGLDNGCYSSYWKVRFGLASAAEPKFDFLLGLDYHPDYLSHWLIDLEGLDALKAKRGQ